MCVCPFRKGLIFTDKHYNPIVGDGMFRSHGIHPEFLDYPGSPSRLCFECFFWKDRIVLVSLYYPKEILGKLLFVCEFQGHRYR